MNCVVGTFLYIIWYIYFVPLVFYLETDIEWVHTQTVSTLFRLKSPLMFLNFLLIAIVKQVIYNKTD